MIFNLNIYDGNLNTINLLCYMNNDNCFSSAVLYINTQLHLTIPKKA